MPRVPDSPDPSALTSPLPAAYQSSLASPDLLGAGARQTQQAGEAALGAGDELARIRNQLLDQGNAMRVDDAVNQLTERALRLQDDPKEGFTTQTGYAAVNRDSGLPLADEYTQQLQKHAGDIAGTLSNDRQRAMFAMRANNIVTSFNGRAMTYETQQYKEYNLSTKQATVENAQNALALNPQDPDNIAQQVTRIRSSIMGGQDPVTGTFIPGSAQMQGKSATWAQQQADDAVSKAHENAIKNLLESGDVNAALAYFKSYAPQMTAAGVIGVRGTLQRQYDERNGQVDGTTVVNQARPALAPATDADRAKNIMVQLESGKRGDFGPDGQLLKGPVTSSGEQALGSRQVMPSTARDPGYGIKPADLSGTPQQQAAELRRVSDQKWDVLVKMFDGDLPKVYAAYNAGEGTVKSAVAAADKEGPNGNWLAKMPPETQTYVASATSLLQSGAGVPPKPTLDDLQAQVRNTLGPGASPTRLKAALDAVNSQFSAVTAANKQRGEEAVSQAMRILDNNGGDMATLPPSVREAVIQLAPDKMETLELHAKRTALGVDTTNLPRYNDIVSHMDQYAKMSDNGWDALRTELSHTDFKALSKQRQDYINGSQDTSSEGLNVRAMNRALDAGLTALKIPTSVPKTDLDGQERLGGIRKFVTDSILNAQAQSGQKMTEADISKHVNGLFATDVTFKGTLWGQNSTKLMSLQIGDLPTGAREGLTQSLIKSGNKAPTDTDVLNLYRKLHTTPPAGQSASR